MELEHRKGFKQPEVAFPKLHFIPMGPCRKPALYQCCEGRTETHRNATTSDQLKAILRCSRMLLYARPLLGFESTLVSAL